MSWSKPSAALAAGLGLAFLAGTLSWTRPGHPPNEGEPIHSLFPGTNVPAFSLVLNDASMQSLRRHPRDWVPGTLSAGNETYSNVGVHIKGSQGSLRTIDAHPSLTVSFTRFAGGRKFHGLRKIHFNNSAEDPSFMTEILCSELCRQAGLPAARSAHATLALNGRAHRLYVLTEGLTKEFLGQFFSKTGGNLYDGGFRRDIDEPLDRVGGEGPDNQADRLALLAAAREPDPAQRWERLQKVLDTDRFLSLLAMSTILWNWDGYPMARNNYRIYHDPTTDRLVFFPHGQDQMFWRPDGPIYPPLQGLLARAVMRVPEARTLYRERLASLHGKVFQVQRLHNRIDELVALITPYRNDAQEQGARLKQLIAGRSRSIAEQLAGAPRRSSEP